MADGSVQTRAAVLERTGGPFVLRDVALEAPRPDEVRVRIRAVGVCHTDLAHRDGLAAFAPPAVLGHEGSGVVETVGSEVTHVQPGDPVVLSYFSCRTCPSCRSRRPAYCASAFAGNFAGARPDGSRPIEADGEPVASAFFSQSSFAHHALAHRSNVVKVDPDLPLETLGPLGCGFQTGAGAVFNVLDLKPGQSLAVFGAGAVGLAAVMAAKAVGAGRIVAVDLNPDRLALAQEFGATDVFPGDQPDLARAIRKATGGGVDAALDCVGAPAVLGSAFAVLAAGGACVMLGLPRPGAEIAVDMRALLGGRRLIGSIEGDADPHLFIPRLLDLHRRGLFPFERLIRFYPFEDINTAVHDMETGRTVKPVLLMPHQEP